MSITDRLDEIQGRADAATHGPWERDNDYDIMGRRPGLSPDPELDPVIGHLERDEDDEFIAHARADVPALVAALRAVLDLHKPVEVEPSDTICRECSFQLPNGRYFGRLEEWPCPTFRAIEAALGEVQR